MPVRVTFWGYLWAILQGQTFVMQALLLALLLIAGASGQAGLVTGTVVDSSGAPIPNATVRLDVSGARWPKLAQATMAALH